MFGEIIKYVAYLLTSLIIAVIVEMYAVRWRPAAAGGGVLANSLNSFPICSTACINVFRISAGGTCAIEIEKLVCVQFAIACRLPGGQAAIAVSVIN